MQQYLSSLLKCHHTISKIIWKKVRLGYLSLASNFLIEEFVVSLAASTTADPFQDYGLQRRQELCDVAINAKQFMLNYSSKYHAQSSDQPIPSLTTWYPPNTVLNRTTNYQRSLPTPLDPDPVCLKCQSHSVVIGGNFQVTIQVEAIQCVNKMNVKWYLTFGWVDNFMYLLEESQSKQLPGLLVTSLLEPQAIVANRPAAYFMEWLTASASKVIV